MSRKKIDYLVDSVFWFIIMLLPLIVMAINSICFAKLEKSSDELSTITTITNDYETIRVDSTTTTIVNEVVLSSSSNTTTFDAFNWNETSASITGSLASSTMSKGIAVAIPYSTSLITFNVAFGGSSVSTRSTLSVKFKQGLPSVVTRSGSAGNINLVSHGYSFHVNASSLEDSIYYYNFTFSGFTAYKYTIEIGFGDTDLQDLCGYFVGTSSNVWDAQFDINPTSSTETIEGTPTTELINTNTTTTNGNAVIDKFLYNLDFINNEYAFNGNVIYTSFDNVVGSSGIFPIFKENSITLKYLVYVLCVLLVHVLFDFIAFFPRLIHSFMDKLYMCGGLKND